MSNKKRYPMPIPFGWYVVDYAEDLNSGDVKSVRYFGQDQVLFRTTNGEVSMLDAYCPHLGAHLGHGGIINGECIECPFHAWRWKADGRIGEIPYAKNIPQKAKDTQIFKYPTVERNNLIYAWYHPHGDQPHYEVETYPEVTIQNGEMSSRNMNMKLNVIFRTWLKMQWMLRTSCMFMALYPIQNLK